MPSQPKLRVTWTRSTIGTPARHRATVRALGLRRLHQTVFHDDTPSLRGMLHAVRHLVTVAPASDEEYAAASAPAAKAPAFILRSGPPADMPVKHRPAQKAKAPKAQKAQKAPLPPQRERLGEGAPAAAKAPVAEAPAAEAVAAAPAEEAPKPKRAAAKAPAKAEASKPAAKAAAPKRAAAAKAPAAKAPAKAKAEAPADKAAAKPRRAPAAKSAKEPKA